MLRLFSLWLNKLSCIRFDQCHCVDLGVHLLQHLLGDTVKHRLLISDSLGNIYIMSVG